MDGSKLLYSTDKSFKESGKTSAGPAKVRLESKGRGGKRVTVVFNLPFAAEEAKSHLRQLQKQLGTGGTFKNDTLELSGDVRERVVAYFKEQGVRVLLKD